MALANQDYALMKRCGIDPAVYISDEDFQPIFDFNAPDAVYALGKIVSTATEDVLRDIERTVKNYERVQLQTAERSDINGRLDVQTARGFDAVLNTCTAAQRRRFRLHYVQGYTLEEIASLEKCTNQAVSDSIENVKRKIKKYFS